MDFADSSLVYLAKRESLSTIFTVDHADFNTYRIEGRRRFRVLPVNNPRALRDQRIHHLPRDIRKPEIPTLEFVRQPCVVEAQQLQHRGVQIVHVDFIFGHLEA